MLRSRSFALAVIAALLVLIVGVMPALGAGRRVRQPTSHHAARSHTRARHRGRHRRNRHQQNHHRARNHKGRHRAHHKKTRRHATPRTGSGAPHAQPTGPNEPSQSAATQKSSTSLNWSGYAVTPGSGVTAVKSSFTVPAVGLLPPGFAAIWTGIGGYSTSDLIQAGVAEQSLPSNPLTGPQYYPWYEMLPAGAVQLTNCTGDPTCAVTPGQQVTVEIAQTTPGNWKVSLQDAGHWSWQQQFAYRSSGSSAEWILEAPTVISQQLLAGVGTVHFGPDSTFTEGSTTRTIAQGNPTSIVLSPLPIGGLLNEATPSPLAANGQSFNSCAYRTSCPTP